MAATKVNATANGHSDERFRCIWISDVHLGTPDCQAEALLGLLRRYRYDKLVLAGDIVDLWALKRRSYWPDSHRQLLELLLSLSDRRCEVIFVPGNHDEWFRRFDGIRIRGIRIEQSHKHQSLSGLNTLTIHGDRFDAEIAIGRFHARLGDRLYDVLLWLNRALHQVRKRCGLPYWSLASYIKSRVSKAQSAIAKYRSAALRYCAATRNDMLICGHIHQPELLESQGLIYANTGDWVENTTLIAETAAGNLQLLRWDHANASLTLEQEMLLAEPPVHQLAS
ncbi:UDP-2,3-diacylglucosamine diphosphatase [Shewanella sp. JM162201]|uniref:UDP-2,3-diacylglucosamine diphosphatase n=1 Tax=Shewanella jiangmenensis TaxID=2837387 RepID=A0ABS5V0N9_9GAMM|nr:UDP-2,3-diacylglucosamine diphosphatase [Shewanella jiangmenensis]MBT1443450.1 UDP-2,3-diacylglucosamine diphosphatase [Shewanella jiangmenensis]